MNRLVIVFLVRLCLQSSVAWEFYPEDRTMLEDVVGDYDLKSIRKLIQNMSQSLQNQIMGQSESTLQPSDLNALQQVVVGNQNAIQSSVSSLSEKMTKLEKDWSTQSKLIQELSKRVDSIDEKSSSNAVLEDKIGRLLEQGETSMKLVSASDCYDLYQLGYNASGTYWLQKFGLRVMCDMELDGGGWLEIQKRAKVGEQVNFDQNWSAYKIGFGHLNTEFWIGNDILHTLTNQKVYELLVEMQDYQQGPYFARYKSFRVGNEDSHFMLDLGDFSGNVTDAFTYHHGQIFSTKDRDNDLSESTNCAEYFSGGWWYNRCYDAHLNGLFPDPPNRANASYITWWQKSDNTTKFPLVLDKVVLKIRPSQD